jgi:hypothetical protein
MVTTDSAITGHVRQSNVAAGMAAVNRPRGERLVKIDCRLLDSQDGCGLMLAGIPRYRPDNVFSDVMRKYDCPNVFADKRAARLLDENETLMRKFCRQADEYKVNLKQNFRTVYAQCGIYLAVDPGRCHDTPGVAYFLAEPEHYLALANYFRDGLTGVVKSLGLSIKGSTGRLTQAGWRNLFDLCGSTEFRNHCSQVKHIEVMVVTTTAEWRAPSLHLGVSLLNLGSVGTVIGTALVALATADAASLPQTESALSWRIQPAPQTACPLSAV